MARLSFTLLLIGLVAILVALIWFLRELSLAAKGAGARLAELDQRYEAFIKKRITLAILEAQQTPPDWKPIIDDALKVLKPEIEALASHIEANSTPWKQVRHRSPYFQNLIALCGALQIRRRHNPGKVLSPADRQQMLDAVRDAIEADLANRWLDIRTHSAIQP